MLSYFHLEKVLDQSMENLRKEYKKSPRIIFKSMGKTHRLCWPQMEREVAEAALILRDVLQIKPNVKIKNRKSWNANVLKNNLKISQMWLSFKLCVLIFVSDNLEEKRNIFRALNVIFRIITTCLLLNQCRWLYSESKTKECANFKFVVKSSVK